MVTVASLLQIMDLGSLDSFRDLQPIYAKSFVNRLHLILQIESLHLFAFLQKGTKQGLYHINLVKFDKF